ncbi:MAG: hypothetical protein ACTHKZ_07780, partial [Lysobacteraceae bacterium]
SQAASGRSACRARVRSAIAASLWLAIAAASRWADCPLRTGRGGGGLAGADVSIAIGDGAALAQRAADLVLASPSLARIPQAIALARRTRRVVRQNIAWAIGYNLLALPLAACGLVTPWLAALGMAASSLLVTLNALRLARTASSPEQAA